MLDPEVLVNLLAELCVRVDLMGCSRWVGNRFTPRREWFVWVTLYARALSSETNEFHKSLSAFVDSSRSARNEEPSSWEALNSSPTPDAFKFQTNLEIPLGGVSA